MLRDAAFTPKTKAKKETQSSKLKEARRRFSQIGGGVSGADMVIARATNETRDAIDRIDVMIGDYSDLFAETELDQLRAIRASLLTTGARFTAHRKTLGEIYNTKLQDKGPQANE